MLPSQHFDLLMKDSIVSRVRSRLAADEAVQKIISQRLTERVFRMM